MSNAPHGLRRSGDDGWRESFDQQVEKFQSLTDNPDRRSPNRPPNYVVKTAREIAERCASVSTDRLPQLIIAATSEGGIQLKWSKPERELSFLVYPDQSIDYLYIARDRTSRKSGSVDTVDQIDDVARLLFS